MRISCSGEGNLRSWTLENDSLSVRLSLEGLNLTVTDRRCGKQWQMEPERDGFLIQRLGLQHKRPLRELELTDWREAREGSLRGVELRSVCPNPWIQFNVRIRFLLAENDSELVIQVAPHEDPGYTAERWIREIYYPRSFVHSASAKSFTVMPYQQGTLLPGNWPHAIVESQALSIFYPWAWQACTGPWWGHIDSSGACYAAIMETADDAIFDFEHPAGGPTRVAPRWLTSFEAFRYPRRISYWFFPRGDHVTIALAYRDYCRRIGRWRSIEEKRLEKPQLDKLRGAIALRLTAMMTSLKRDGITKQFQTFHQIAETLRATIAEHPGENIYFHLAGWQTLGYDHAHPAACPPCPEAGGWDGMREISQVAKEHGILFATHEQYRDFYYSSPFWSEERTRKDSRRDSPRHAYWAGATQSILCPMLMLDFVKMNVQQLRDQHIELNATYQDVLTAIALEECYDHRHPATRTQCREARNSIFEYYRQLEWLIKSESASDWAAPALDAFYIHWPRQPGEEEGKALGIPVPLFSLVFHDCAILESRGTPRLMCALGGVNSMHARDRLLRRLHAETAYMPLTAHRILSEDGQEQESVFGDQVRVWANLATGQYRISGLKGTPEIAGQLQDGFMA